MSVYDIFVIGGGINGCGVARDAAGRGYSVFLAEMDDLASGTSSGSSKLVHGGLRYLEHCEFRLVRESLREREIIWKNAPHIIWPIRFVLPYAKGIRPAWLLRFGLFLYDHIGGRKLLPGTRTIDMRMDPEGEPPAINIFGGKITTYRRLSEHVLEKIEDFLGKKGACWTANAALPGGDFPATGFDAQVTKLTTEYPFLAAHLARRLTSLYGTRAKTLLGLARTEADLGRKFGPDLYEREVRYLIDHEWAVAAEDVLWRRTKRGLTLSRQGASALDECMKDIPGLQNAAAE